MSFLEIDDAKAVGGVAIRKMDAPPGKQVRNFKECANLFFGEGIFRKVSLRKMSE